MKKLGFLISFIFMFSSCSSDDSDEYVDPLIGTWRPVRIEHVTEDNPRTTTILNECERSSRYQFNADGTISQWNIYALDESNNCSIQTSLVSGSWVRTTDPSDFRNRFFELSLRDNNVQEIYSANDHYHVTFIAAGGISWRKEIIGDYLYLEKVE